MYHFNVGCDKTRIDYSIEYVGDDIEITVTGGRKHIGSICLVTSDSYDILTVKHHKEDEIVEYIARNIMDLTNDTVLIKAGIHIDDITKDEIDVIRANNEKATINIRSFLKKQFIVTYQTSVINV